MPDETSFQDFQDAMAIIADRLRLVQEWPAHDRAYIFVVESYALHLRKIVEGLSFAALSAFEHAEGLLQHLHRKDPDALLRHLQKKGLLALPSSADVARSPNHASTIIVTPRPERDLQPHDLYDIWTRASAHIHERHPERISKETLEKAVAECNADASKLRSWLWSHRVHHRGQLFLVQMALAPQPGFVVLAQRPVGCAGPGYGDDEDVPPAGQGSSGPSESHATRRKIPRATAAPTRTRRS